MAPIHPPIRPTRKRTYGRRSIRALTTNAVRTSALPRLDRKRPQVKTPPKPQSSGEDSTRQPTLLINPWVIKPQPALRPQTRERGHPLARLGCIRGLRRPKETPTPVTQLNSPRKSVLEERDRSFKEGPDLEVRPVLKLRAHVLRKLRDKGGGESGRLHSLPSGRQATTQIQEILNEIAKSTRETDRSDRRSLWRGDRIPKSLCRSAEGQRPNRVQEGAKTW